MNLSTMVLIALLLIAVWWLVRKRRAALTEESQPTARRRNSNAAFHAVSIHFSANACNAAKAMAGRRFLATAAPTLPLPDCNVLECNCRFAHHDDRRSGKDRRSPFASRTALMATGEFEREQRTGKDRRTGTDFDPL